MNTYIHAIGITQKILLTVGILTLMILPLTILFYPDVVDRNTMTLYSIVHATVFFVMMIRPLADIFPHVPYVRPLVILRKGFGVVSASIVVSFILAKVAINPLEYFSSWFTPSYWSLTGNILFAHLADISAILLLLTSNVFSKRVLGPWWKRIQKLAYVYFYASGLYVFLSYGETLVFFYMFVVTLFVIIAFFMNRKRTQLTHATI